jgi:hypothetical protein
MDSELVGRLAGFFCSHAVWCVSEGETLTPFVGFETFDGKRHIHRFLTDRIEQGIQEGKDRLARNPDQASRAVLIYDGLITLPTGKVDALILDIRDYGFPSWSLVMAVPYRNAKNSGGFAVHRPKVVSFAGPEPNYQSVGSAFFEGAYSHEKGGAIWNARLDESL